MSERALSIVYTQEVAQSCIFVVLLLRYGVGLKLPPRAARLDIFKNWSASFHGVKSTQVTTAKAMLSAVLMHTLWL